VGNKVAGTAAGFISTAPLPVLFGTIAAVCLGTAVIAALLIRPVKSLMGGVH
jgi:proton-dependent oligopeptide transporter, POT family